jgi:hypothetical protein
MVSRSDLATRVRALLDPRQSRGRASLRQVAAVLTAFAAVALALAPLRAVGDSRRFTNQASALEQSERRIDRMLFEAADTGDLDRVILLIAGGANVNAALPGDGSPLIAAARGGRVDVLRLLLDRGADPNGIVPGDGSPLIAAARQGHADVVEMLLARGASVDQVAEDDENALIQASAAGQLRVVRLLVAHGAHVSARVWAARGPREGEWRTPLNMARRGGHDDVAAFLGSAGAVE